MRQARLGTQWLMREYPRPSGGGSAAGAVAEESTASEAGAAAPAVCEVQWEAALQLGGASRLLVLPAGEAPALQFLLASADAHAASAECGQAAVHGRGALSMFPLRRGGLSLQVRVAGLIWCMRW